MSNILGYLEGLLGEGTYHSTNRGGQYSFHCPLCSDYKERLFFHLGKKVGICHNCGWTGSVIAFISTYAHITYAEALKVYRDYEGYEIKLPDSLEDEIYSMLIKAPEAPVEKFIHPLPDEFILIEEARGKAGNDAIRYLFSRGISLDMAERNYLGYCAEGDYANRIIMPDFENGDIVYWQGRTWLPAPKNPIMRKFYRKAMNPSLTDEQKERGIVSLDKSDVISNIDHILVSGVAVICEGRMDAYTIGDNGACIHGKVLSDSQFTKLVKNKSKISTILIMLDGDALGNAIKIAERLYKHFSDIYVCLLPEKEDPNSLGRKGVLQAINNAEPYNPMLMVKLKMKGLI